MNDLYDRMDVLHDENCKWLYRAVLGPGFSFRM